MPVGDQLGPPHERAAKQPGRITAMIRFTARRAAALAATGVLAGAGWLAAASPALAAGSAPAPQTQGVNAAADSAAQVHSRSQAQAEAFEAQQRAMQMEQMEMWRHHCHYGLLGGLLHAVGEILDGVL
jgi:hypothetical protein